MTPRFVYWASGDPPEDLPTLAAIVEAAGFDGMALGEHVVIPAQLLSDYPGSEDGSAPFRDDAPWADPLVAVAAMAAKTERLQFMTSVYVLPLRQPLVALKAASTAAVLSGSRLEFGIGVGWSPEESAALDQDFASRGRRCDESLEIFTQLREGPWLEHHGEHYDFGRVAMSPVPAEPIPIYVGGDGLGALRRAGRYGDGWIAPPLIGDRLVSALATIDAERELAGRADQPFDVACALLEGTTEEAAGLIEAGATTLMAGPWFLPEDEEAARARSLPDWSEERIAAFVADVVQPIRASTGEGAKCIS
jgi:probable F420-dependent oxidoreductase